MTGCAGEHLGDTRAARRRQRAVPVSSTLDDSRTSTASLDAITDRSLSLVVQATLDKPLHRPDIRGDGGIRLWTGTTLEQLRSVPALASRFGVADPPTACPKPPDHADSATAGRRASASPRSPTTSGTASARSWFSSSTSAVASIKTIPGETDSQQPLQGRRFRCPPRTDAAQRREPPPASEVPIACNGREHHSHLRQSR